MRKAILFIEHCHGHDTDTLTKSEAVKLMEEYSEANSPPIIDFNGPAIFLICMIFIAGIVFGAAAASYF